MSKEWRTTLLLFAGLAFVGLCLALGFGAGLVVGELKGYQRQTEAELAEVTPTATGRPGLQKPGTPAAILGGVELIGSVQSKAEYERLNVELVKMFGRKPRQ